LGVEQFAGVRGASYLLGMGITRVLFVEAAQGRLESARIPGCEILSHYLGLMAQLRYAGKQD
jgi:hypothetical protein